MASIGATICGPHQVKHLRIGVDVGGTNTDGVILDPSRASEPDKGILAWHKTATTSDPSIGITSTITALLEKTAVNPAHVASVTIGTTHFVNAVVERDADRLAPVAVVRLCGPFSKHVPPCIDWPDDVRELVLGYHVLVQGGLEVDGSLIADIDEEEIRRECAIIREKDITNVVVNGVFSPIDTIERQEERAAEIVRREIPGCDVVCSKEVAHLGFLERENAAILNASISGFAKRTIRSFRTGVRRLGLRCPVLIAQNDGTVLSGEMAARLPIRTFSSGPTNSMRGAAFLVQGLVQEAVMVVDIGGTTTDVGVLQANGFPRQQAAYSDLAGIRMNFSCPDIKSIGLGGGSIVRRGERLTVGPDSVGYKLTSEAMVFGGSTLTATDCAVLVDPIIKIGEPLDTAMLWKEELYEFSEVVRKKLEKIIDTMKTTPEDIPVLLVGGGTVIAPDTLRGASKVIKPRWSEVANAVGAAIAGVSAVVDTVKSTELYTTAQLLEKIKVEAIEKAVEAGAVRSSVKIVEVETLPLQYIEHKSRFVVRAAGDIDYSRSLGDEDLDDRDIEEDNSFPSGVRLRASRSKEIQAKEEVDGATYRPNVRNREWFISETDLDWITTGCYILGTGGGGSPYSSMIRLRSMLRRGDVIRVVNPYDLADDAQIGCGSGAGSPTVGIEKLAGDEMVEAQRELRKVCDLDATHMISIEIGGANGLASLLLGASSMMDLPVVDGDWMGRAYPTKWQTTPVVFKERETIWAPIAMCNGNGDVVVMTKATSDRQVEKVMRAALSQMGSQTACADPPVTGAETKRWVVEHTISQSWRIGRAVADARQTNRIDDIGQIIVDACGGPNAGKVLFKGKIVGIERTLRMGHVYGECIIEGAAVTGDDNCEDDGRFQGRIKIPFQNENIAALRINKGREERGFERQQDVLAIVPDLITIIDAQNGEAIGTPEYRYGLLVIVLGLAASDRWTGSKRGLTIGGPAGFGFDHLKYQTLGSFVKPVSVIDEFNH